MKNFILIPALFILSLCASAQDIAQSQVPSIIVNSFKQNFPKASDVEWELKGDVYEVDFEIGFIDHEAHYNKSGKLIRLKQEIKESDLPAEVRASAGKDFNGFRMSDVKKIDQQGAISYKMEMKKGNEEWIVVYDSKGKQLSKTAD